MGGECVVANTNAWQLGNTAMLGEGSQNAAKQREEDATTAQRGKS